MNRNETKEEMERLQKENDVLFNSKVCPDCGERFAVCKKPINSASFPKLNVVDPNLESAYYCPNCQKYFESDGDYKLWTKTVEERFESNGKKYRFTKQFTNARIKRVMSLLFAGAVTITPLFIYFLRKAILSFSFFSWLISVISGVAIFVLAYFGVYYYRMVRVCHNAYIEIATDGVIFCDGAQTSYLKWEDFRIASAIQNDNDDIQFAFDTETTSFIVNQNMEDYRELALLIADKIKDTAQLEPKILHMIYGG